jgi:hypothetical protein
MYGEVLRIGVLGSIYYSNRVVSATLKHVAKTVAHVELSDHVINVVFTIFDENRKLTVLQHAM